MKYILVIAFGLTVGYAWGYTEARDGKPSLMARALDKFGVQKVKDAADRREADLTP